MISFPVKSNFKSDSLVEEIILKGKRKSVLVSVRENESIARQKRNDKSEQVLSFVYFIILMILSIAFCNPVNKYWDIIAADEISYLRYGKELFSSVHFDWGFIYNVWYKFLSLFTDSTIELYYLNYKVLVTLVPLLLYVCLSIYGVQSFFAFTISFLYLISKLHVTTWPFVSDFCVLLMLSYFIAIKLIKDIGWKSIVLTFVSLLLYLSRPEYIIAFGIALLLAIYNNRKNKLRWLSLLPMIAIVYYVGQKSMDVKGFDRGFFAFAQHYFVTYTIWHKSAKIDAYQYFELAPKIFGKSFTLIGSVLYNPMEAIRHVLTCIGFYFLNIIKALEDFLFPSLWFHFLGKLKHVLFVALLFFIVKKTWKKKLKLDNKTDFLQGIGLFFLVACIPNFLIGYCTHYVQLHFVLYILLLGIFLLKENIYKIGRLPQLVITVLFVFLIPSIGNYNFAMADYKESKNLPVQKLAAFINNHNDKKQHYMIAYQTNLHYVFDGNNFDGTDIFSIDKPFLEYIEKNKVDYIYINEQLLSDVKLSKDKQWQALFATPEKYNFYRQNIPASNNYLLIKRIN